MNDTVEAKLTTLDAMNKALGKIVNVHVRLTLAGETALAAELDAHRKELLAQIEKLQGQVADQWSVDAATLTEQLRVANGSVQTNIRNIQNQVNVASSAVAIIGQIGSAMNLLKTVVP
jgi:hypothetical protein